MAKELFDSSVNGFVAAIIKQAADDYRWALQNKNHPEETRRTTARHYLIEVPVFFRSGWFEMLCGLDGEEMLAIIEKQETVKRRKRKRI